MTRAWAWCAVLLYCCRAWAGGDSFAWETRGDVGRCGARTAVEMPDGQLLTVRQEVQDGLVRMVVTASRDGGRSWGDLGVIGTDVAGTDLGDCHLVRLRSGRLLCSYRRNHHRPADGNARRYAIEVAESADGGQTWALHSVVERSQPAAGRGPSQGLWSSFLLERTDGVLQCYYDDEMTPFREGFGGHQWVVMRTWDEGSRQWVRPVVVSRAHDSKDLSRDGMPSVVEISPGRLLIVEESVRVNRPHANVVRCVTSDDGGQTWSWRDREREVVYGPAKEGFMSLSPWVTRLRDGRLACVFCTDEDRDRPDVSGTPPVGLHMDVKVVWSGDDGKSWSQTATAVYAGGHRNYMPGVLERTAGELVVNFIDYAGGGCRVVVGHPVQK